MDYKLTEEQVRQIKKDFSNINGSTYFQTTTGNNKWILLARKHPFRIDDKMTEFIINGVFRRLLAGQPTDDELQHLILNGVSEFSLSVVIVPEQLLINQGKIISGNFFDWINDVGITIDLKKYGLS